MHVKIYQKMKRQAYRIALLVFILNLNIALHGERLTSCILRWGGEEEHVGQIQKHLSSGADVNHVSRSGSTPLGIAAMFGYTKTAELLINHGADVDFLNGGGQTALHTAIAFGYTEMVECLIRKGTDVNKPTAGGYTPLVLAVSHDAIDILNLLIRSGARLNQTTKRGYTALHFARYHEKAARELLVHDVDLDIENQNSETALYALEKGIHLRIRKEQPFFDEKPNETRVFLEIGLMLFARNKNVDSVFENSSLEGSFRLLAEEFSLCKTHEDRIRWASENSFLRLERFLQN